MTHLEAIIMLLNTEGVDLEDYELDEDTEKFFADNQNLLKKSLTGVKSVCRSLTIKELFWRRS